MGIKPEPWLPVEPPRLAFVHSLFSHDMVLQCDILAPVWGWSTPGDVVVVSFDGKPVGEPATGRFLQAISIEL